MTSDADEAPQVPTRVLSSTQLAVLAERGEELTAEVGEKLYEIGDATYPFIAILEGEAAVLDGAGHEIVRHGASGFLGEVNLLSGQSVFVTAVVTQPLRYIALPREDLRMLLFDDPSLSDLILGALVERRELLQRRQGIGPEIVGPRESPRHAPAARVRASPAAAPHLGRSCRDGRRRRRWLGDGALRVRDGRWCVCPAASSL